MDLSQWTRRFLVAVFVAVCLLDEASAQETEPGDTPNIFTPAKNATNVSFLAFRSTGRWTDGAVVGVIHLYKLLPGNPNNTNNWVLVAERYGASTPAIAVDRLEPDTPYIVRFRNITSRIDPWATKPFRTTPVPGNAGTLLPPKSNEDGSLSLTVTNALHGAVVILERSDDCSFWYEIASDTVTNSVVTLSDPVPTGSASYRVKTNF